MPLNNSENTLLAEKQLLCSGIEALGLQLTVDKLDKLMAYLALFERWNKAYNLSAIRNTCDMVVLHLLDSLSVARFIHHKTLADVGTGPGLPGIPLAIVYPEKHFTLIDSAGKKTRFLAHVKNELSLTNLTIFNGRVESFKPEKPLQAVISRAFASLEDMLACCAHLIDEKGVIFAMKGKKPDAELSLVEKHYKVSQIHHLSVPNLQAERCLIEIIRADNETQ